MKTQVLGLIAQMHVGKDTLAAHLINSDTLWQRLAFADKLKEVVDLLSMPKTRAMYQNVGAGLRVNDPECWTRAVEEQIIEAPVASKFVITDVRYPNEVEMIQRFGGTLIVLTASDEDRWDRYLTSDKFDPRKIRETWDKEQHHETEHFARLYSGSTLPPSVYSLGVKADMETGTILPPLPPVAPHHKINTSGLTDIAVYAKMLRLLGHLGVIG